MISQVDDDAAAFGLPLDAIQPSEDEKPFEVFEENAQAVETFLRCSTQWRTSFGGLVGLDYVAVIEIMRICGIVEIKATLEQVQIMERAALSIMNKGD